MTLEEKRAWIRLVVAVIAYGAYAVVVIAGASGGPLADAPYAAALLWSVGGAVAASILAETLLAGRDSREIDVRDREIGRFGDHTGQSLLVVGAVAGMLMAIADWDGFWIANVIYLGFVLSAVLGGVTKVVLYRTGTPW